MSDFQQQLQHAKAAYLRQAYPGDLAAELLPIPMADHSILASRTIRWLAAGAFGSLAAGVAIACILLSGLFSHPSEDSLPIDTPALQFVQAEPANLQLPPMPQLPADLPEFPDYQALIMPGMPSFPAAEPDMPQQDSPTTQETVL